MPQQSLRAADAETGRAVSHTHTHRNKGQRVIHLEDGAKGAGDSLVLLT